MGDAAVGGGVAVGGAVFHGGAGFELEAGVAKEGVAGAVEGAAELVDAVVVQVVAGGFAGELEGGGVVAVGDLALVGLGGGGGETTETITQHADVWSRVCVVEGGDFSEGIGSVEGGEADACDRACPGALGETTGEVVLVVCASVYGIALGEEQTGGGLVVPSGQGGADGWSGGWGGDGPGGCDLPGAKGNQLAIGVVFIPSGIKLAAPAGLELATGGVEVKLRGGIW